jgi:hypothetical protein
MKRVCGQMSDWLQLHAQLMAQWEVQRMRLFRTLGIALHCQRAYLADIYKVRTSHHLLWHNLKVNIPKSLLPLSSIFPAASKKST